jgi:hypothetical protein
METDLPAILNLTKHDHEPPLWSCQLGPADGPMPWLHGLTTEELYRWKRFRRAAKRLTGRDYIRKLTGRTQAIWNEHIAHALKTLRVTPELPPVSDEPPRISRISYPWALVQTGIDDVDLYYIEMRIEDQEGTHYKGRACTPDGDHTRRNLVFIAPFRILYRWARLPDEAAVQARIIYYVERLRDQQDPRYKPGYVSISEKKPPQKFVKISRGRYYRITG